jgi:hypothetical protein
MGTQGCLRHASVAVTLLHCGRVWGKLESVSSPRKRGGHRFKEVCMRKSAVTVAALAVCAVSLVAQEVSVIPASTMLNVRNYSSYFLDKKSGEFDINYELASSDYDYYDKVAALGNNDTLVDTPLEIALLSYSAGVVDIRPVQAAHELPANNPKLAGLKLGAAVYQEIQILRFLGNTAAVGLHEGELKFITDKGNVTRAEVEAYYRNGIRSLIADAVNVEFNKISFRIDRHNATLTRNSQNGQYILNYGGVNTNNETRTITANSLEALSSEIRNGRNKNDFTSADLDTVRSQAALIPAVVLNKQALDEITEILTKFYTSPGQSTYNYVRDIYILYEETWIASKNQLFSNIAIAYNNALYDLNQALAAKVVADSRRASVTALPADQQQRLLNVQR